MRRKLQTRCRAPPPRTAPPKPLPVRRDGQGHALLERAARQTPPKERPEPLGETFLPAQRAVGGVCPNFDKVGLVDGDLAVLFVRPDSAELGGVGHHASVRAHDGEDDAVFGLRLEGGLAEADEGILTVGKDGQDALVGNPYNETRRKFVVFEHFSIQSAERNYGPRIVRQIDFVL